MGVKLPKQLSHPFLFQYWGGGETRIFFFSRKKFCSGRKQESCEQITHLVSEHKPIGFSSHICRVVQPIVHNL